MKPVIVIFGANGFLGRYLSRHFARQGYEVAAIARSREGWSGDGMLLEWDGGSPGPWAEALEGAEAVINLAGRSVNCRYGKRHRREIRESRVTSTRVIGEAITRCQTPPKVWMNASTATLYRHAEDRPQDEWTGERGEGFSVEVATAWEEAFFAMKTPPATRKLALRTGMVLANEPGTVFDVMTKLVRCGLGGAMGAGTQRMSWIHLDDWLRAVDFLLADPWFDGVVNLTAPDWPLNRELMREWREIEDVPFGLPATEWMLELGAWLMGTETELVLKSRWVEPCRLREAGFRWRFPRIGPALADLRKRRGLDAFFLPVTSRAVGARAWLPGRA